MVHPLWNGVYALRFAESLAGLGNVAGASDAPPERPEDEESWVRDWAKRGRDALARAREMYDESKRRGVDALRERAQKIATAVKDGARSVLRGVKKVSSAVLDELHELQRTAQSVSNAWSSTQGVFALLILGALALYYMPRRRQT